MGDPCLQNFGHPWFTVFLSRGLPRVRVYLSYPWRNATCAKVWCAFWMFHGVNNRIQKKMMLEVFSQKLKSTRHRWQLGILRANAPKTVLRTTKPETSRTKCKSGTKTNHKIGQKRRQQPLRGGTCGVFSQVNWPSKGAFYR